MGETEDRVVERGLRAKSANGNFLVIDKYTIQRMHTIIIFSYVTAANIWTSPKNRISKLCIGNY